MCVGHAQSQDMPQPALLSVAIPHISDPCRCLPSCLTIFLCIYVSVCLSLSLSHKGGAADTHHQADRQMESATDTQREQRRDHSLCICRSVHLSVCLMMCFCLTALSDNGQMLKGNNLEKTLLGYFGCLFLEHCSTRATAV